MNMNIPLPVKKETEQLIRLALPIILSSLLQMTYNIIDMIWVGHLGSAEIAAVGTAGFYIKLGWAISSVITMGAMVLVSHNVGSNDKRALQTYISTSVNAIIAMGALYSLVMLFLPQYLIGFFKIESVQVNTLAETYLKISSVSVILSFLNLLFTSILNAHGKTKLSFRSVLYGNIINIFLDPLFIIVLDGGVAGAAWATVISQLGSSVYFFYIIYKQDLIRIKWLDFSWISLGKLIKIGSSVAIQRILFTLIAIVIGRIVASWGTDAIAAQKLGLQVESISFLLMGGLMQSTSIMTGQSFGAKKYAEIEQIYRSGLKTAAWIGLVTTLIFVIFPDQLLLIFVRDPQTIDMGRSYLIIVGLSQLFMCLEMLTAGTYNGQGLTKYPATVSVVFTSLRIPLALYLGKETSLGIDGVWWSISITSMMKGVVLYFLYRKRNAQLHELAAAHNQPE